MSPPPRAGVGSMFIAGFKSCIVWRLPELVTVSAFAVESLIEFKITLKTEARATAGKKVPVMRSREIRETAERAKRFFLYILCVPEWPAEDLLNFSNKIGVFSDSTSRKTVFW